MPRAIADSTPADGNVVHERLVDLDDVDREAAQVAQRRVARAEVVQGDADAQVADVTQRGGGQHRVGHQDRLGDFQDEPAGPDAGLVHGRGDLVDDAVAHELAGRKVDVHDERRRRRRAAAATRPAAWQAWRRTQPPSGTIRPVSSASGMNSIGGTMPRVGWRQRTRASAPDDLAGLELDDRLVLEDELLAARWRAAVRPPWPRRAMTASCIFGFEDLEARLALRLGRVHRHVGVAQQLGGRVARLVAPRCRCWR